MAMAAAFSLTALLIPACSQDPDERRERMGLPPMDFVGNAEQGQRLFHQYCARCHGQNARGSSQGPPLIHKIYEPSHHADLAFFRAVKNGVKQHHWQFGDMPAVEGISPVETGHIVKYIRVEQARAGIF